MIFNGAVGLEASIDIIGASVGAIGAFVGDALVEAGLSSKVAEIFSIGTSDVVGGSVCCSVVASCLTSNANSGFEVTSTTRNGITV